jgi:hypothetical protein
MRCACFVFLWLRLLPSCFAAPAPPLEGDLSRAETVLIGRLISKPDATHFIFQVGTVLRGRAEATMTLAFDEGGADASVGSLCLLVSQGDDHYGRPRPVVGRPMDSQGAWRGWLELPISTADGHQFVETVYSFADGQPFSDGSLASPKLSIERVKSLIDRYPYNPCIHDKP